MYLLQWRYLRTGSGIWEDAVHRTLTEFLFRAFVAKAVFNISQTSGLILRLKADKTLGALCGYDSGSQLPSESTFSRAFADFARDGIAQKVHVALIEATVKDKLFGHASMDATAIDAREKPSPEPKREAAPKVKAKRGRRKKGEQAPVPDPKRIDLQPLRSLEENIADLPVLCDIGSKSDSKGHAMHWIGYKLHLCVLDGDIPGAAILTSASLHDSQSAIPIMQMTDRRVTHLYDLMDAAYDAEGIRAFSQAQGQVPLIDANARRGQKTPFSPAQKARYAQRSSVERVNSALKDSYGARFIRVWGVAKVMTHLMFGAYGGTDCPAHVLTGLNTAVFWLQMQTRWGRRALTGRKQPIQGAGARVCAQIL
jgi:hypothetical protein